MPSDMIGHSFPTLEEKPYIPTMPNIRIFSVLAVMALVPLWVWAQATSPAPDAGTPGATPAGAVAATTPAEPPTAAEQALDDAAKKVAALKSISAVIFESVEMLKTKFSITGKYLKAPGNRTRLELIVDENLPDAEKSTMLQNCDGEWLWDYQKVLESRNYRKMKIGRILEKLNSPELDDAFREQALNQLGFAGPDILLIGLRKAVKFDQKEAEKLDGKPVWLLKGTWRSRDGLLGPNQQALPPTAPLPAYVPSLVKVWVGQEDGWPYKIELVGRVPTVLLEDTRRYGPDGRPIGSRNSYNIQKVEPSRIELTYSNVQLNPDLKPDDFAFTVPPDARVDDNTDAILDGLEQAMQMRAAQKKSEAAKGETTLPQPIEVPKAAPAPQ
jgi:outer membrane lipoprotein-sorting protein